MGACAAFRGELGVYILGTIAPADRAKVVQHLASCRQCRDEVAGLAALPALIRQLPAATAAQLTGERPCFGEAGPVGGLPERLIRCVRLSPPGPRSSSRSNCRTRPR